MKLTKTTFELEPSMLVQLKATAAHSGKSVRALLTEGAQWVLEKYRNQEDKRSLSRKVQAAKERLRQGYGASSSEYDSDSIDRLLYAAEPKHDWPVAGRRRK